VYANNLFWQLYILSHRNIVRYIRRPIEWTQYVGGYLISAVLIALIFSDIKSNREPQITLGLSFMLDVFSVFSLFGVPTRMLPTTTTTQHNTLTYNIPLPTVMSQRLLFNREREAGAYRTSAFYLADLLCRLPQHLIAVFFYSIIILYLADIHGTLNENGAFLLLVNTVVMQIYLGINETVGMYSCPPLTLISSIADWLILGACMSDADTAIVLAGLINVVNMIFR